MRISSIKNKRIICVVLIMVLILLFSYKHPTFGKYNNRGNTGINVWSGMVASNYRSGNGTRENPYIISTGEELAYFSSQLENNDYSNSYFKIVNNILLNEGMFKYENDVLMYTVNSITYYVNGNEYYDNPNFIGESTGTLNKLNSLNGFKGTIDGDSHTIFGYFSDKALFTSLEGNVTGLSIENAFVNTSSSNGIFADTITSGNISNIIIDGLIIGTRYVPTPDEVIDIELLDDYDNLNKVILGGIASYTNDSTMTNCISKANITGGYISGGVVGYSNNSTITNSYSTGELTSYSSNTIGVFKGTGTINRIYSTSTMNGALIGYITKSSLNISNSFITTDNNLVLDLFDSNVVSNNNYYTYVNRGDNITSTQTTLANLKSKQFLENYQEFVSKNNLKTHPQNIWIFNNDTYPLLYFDDVVNNNSELYISSYMWNSYSKNLNVYNFTNNIVFMISDIDNVHLTDKYYYVSNNEDVLSKSDLENVLWVEYNDAVIISNEGRYIIYVKTVDNNDNVEYINSDILILDNSGSDITITMGENTYTELMNTEVYVDSSFNISVSAEDILSGVSTIEYYLSNTRVNDLTTVNWSTYTDAISVNNTGEYILYVKVVDGCNFISYASTPLIVYDGYIVNNLKPVGFDSGNRITNNSSIMFDITYSNNKQLDIVHNIVSSVALPINTKITLLDKTNNKIYEYVVNNNSATYPLTSFVEKGKTSSSYYTNTQVTNESFTVILDFSNCNIIEDYNNINVYMEGVSNNTIIRPTITKTGFTLLSDNNLLLSHNITTNFNGSINYNSDSISNVLIHNNVTMANAIDTSLSNKKLGLAIRIEDSENNIIESEYLKNIIFKIGDNKYAPDDDNIIHINLNTNTTSDVTLSIITYDGALRLEDGTYYIKIYGYISDDGIYYNNNSLTDVITIPLVVANNTTENLNYNFNVSSTGDVIVNKNDVVDYSFRILQDGLKNPNIKVSMYKKNRLTAYNQEYTLIDMGDYTEAVLDEFIDKIYYVKRNAFSYSKDKKYNVFNYQLDTSTLDKTCYKFVFDLYSGNTKVESISKYIIVR